MLAPDGSRLRELLDSSLCWFLCQILVPFSSVGQHNTSITLYPTVKFFIPKNPDDNHDNDNDNNLPSIFSCPIVSCRGVVYY